jgi:hypothetical protein
MNERYTLCNDSHISHLSHNHDIRSCETPALLVPKQRPCVCRTTSVRSGTAFKMSIPAITNHDMFHDNHQSRA